MPLLFTSKLGTTHSLATRLIRSTANFLEILMYCNTIVTHLLPKQSSTKELYTELHVYFSSFLGSQGMTALTFLWPNGYMDFQFYYCRTLYQNHDVTQVCDFTRSQKLDHNSSNIIGVHPLGLK